MLIRGIASLSRWDGSTIVNRSDATTAGDVISDLRTQNNKLSVWRADSDEDINDALVALSLNRTDVQKVIALLLDEKDLEAMQIIYSDKLHGKAPGAIDSIKIKHRDLLEIDYKRLGFLSDYMMSIVHNKEKRVEISKPSIKKLLEEYKEAGKIKVEEMNEELRLNLNW
ncbi:MAG: hypothetical protein IKX20_09035 [Paludibacteraceae bacterium]|nr:hypothetical protein [Paludibacteraceae bacterium]